MEFQDDDWRSRKSPWDAQTAGFGLLRITLLFGSVAVAIAMLAVPLLQSGIRQSSLDGGVAAGLDTIATGSVRGVGERYVLRRSVLQSSPDAVCVIRENGTRSGAC
jgi:hypothetical protein